MVQLICAAVIITWAACMALPPKQAGIWLIGAITVAMWMLPHPYSMVLLWVGVMLCFPVWEHMRRQGKEAIA